MKGTNGNVLLLLGSPTAETYGYKLATEGTNYQLYVSDGVDLSKVEAVDKESDSFVAPEFCQVNDGEICAFFDREVEQRTDEDGLPLRNVRDLDLEEVSILDNTTTPAYDGTLVAVRSEESSIFFGETFADEIHIRAEEQPNTEEVPKQQETVEEHINYDEYEKLIADMKN